MNSKILIDNIEVKNIIKSLCGRNQMSQNEYEYIASIAKNKKMLVFGTGKDTNLWQKISKYSVFLENDPKWMPKENNQNIYLINYTCKIENYKNILHNLKNGDCSSLIIDLPNQAKDDWDVILVDAPTGYAKGQHGRMQSIYTSYLLANKNTDVFIHDYNRDVEKLFSDYLYKLRIKQIDRLVHVRLK